MTHLADPDAQKRIYEIPSGEQTIAFINAYECGPDSMDVKIYLLVKN